MKYPSGLVFSNKSLNSSNPFKFILMQTTPSPSLIGDVNWNRSYLSFACNCRCGQLKVGLQPSRNVSIHKSAFQRKMIRKVQMNVGNYYTHLLISYSFIDINKNQLLMKSLNPCSIYIKVLRCQYQSYIKRFYPTSHVSQYIYPFHYLSIPLNF